MEGAAEHVGARSEEASRLTSASLRVERLALDDPRWGAFLATAVGVTPSHLPVWTGIVADTYSFPAFALALTRGSEVVAGLPVVDVTTRLRGRRYASLPFTDHVAPLGAVEYLPDLTAALHELRVEERLARIEVRSALPTTVPDAVAYVRGMRHELSLAATLDEAFAALSSHHRRAVRTAERTELLIDIGSSRSFVDDFARLHAATRKRLGVPVQPRRFIDAVGAALERDQLGFIVSATFHGRPVASGLFLMAKGSVIYKFGASDADSWKLRPNNLLVWAAIKHSIKCGATVFDFGRSDVGQDGLAAFKRNFGAVESELIYTSIGSAPGVQLKPGTLSQQIIQRSPVFFGRAVGRALYRYVA